MFAATGHPFHIQVAAFFAALAPIVALFGLMFAASFVQHRRRVRGRNLDYRVP